MTKKQPLSVSAKRRAYWQHAKVIEDRALQMHAVYPDEARVDIHAISQNLEQLAKEREAEAKGENNEQTLADASGVNAKS
jgi:phage-related baseplate assembly protein